MKLYATNVGEMVIRFYLMMAIIIIAGFTKQWWLAAIGFVLFFGALVGAKIKKVNSEEEGGLVHMNGQNQSRKAG